VKQNNFLVHQGRGKIADFGTTFHMAKPPIFTSGSPMFRSPESLLLNNRPNFGIDIWAFGIMAFCLKYRFPPPFANKQNQILRQVSPKAYTNNFFENYIRPLVENGIDELRSFLDLQNSFDQLIHDCLIIDPKERLTAAQAITRLEEMHGQCIATPPIKETLMKLGYIDERLGVEEAKKLLFSLMPQACQRVCIFIQEQGENFVIWINPQNQSLYHSAYSIISHEGEEKISIELLNKKAFSLDDLVSWMLPNRFNSVI
jgi:serine/threonine protein kinase